MAAEFDVPSWLRPPDEAERARIDALTTAAQQKAGVMIRRAVGMRRMQAEATAAIQNGVDPVTAKQNALLNNAHLLFSDNPEAISQLTESEAANRAREKASLQAQARLVETANYHSNLAQQAKDRLAETTKYHQDKLAQDKKAQSGEYTPSILPVVNPLTGKAIPVLRTGPKTSQMIEAKASGRLSEVDKAELKSIYDRITVLQAAHDAIEPEEGAVTQHPNTLKRMRYNLEIRKLRDQAKALESKASSATANDEGDEETPTPADTAKPESPKRLKWTPQGLVPAQ